LDIYVREVEKLFGLFGNIDTYGLESLVPDAVAVGLMVAETP